MLSIRSGKGLGDSLYLQSVARHLTRRGERVEVLSDWPDVFRPLAGKVTVAPFRRNNVSRVAHYIARKQILETDQFEDCCISAGLVLPVELRLDWTPARSAMLGELMSTPRPVVVVQLPRLPMDRVDGYGIELLPDPAMMQRLIDHVRRFARVVQIGRGEPLHRFDGIEIDYANRTTVAEAIDIVAAADAVIGYCSFIVPLAESLGKPGLFAWSSRGLKSENAFIRQIVPKKILHRATSRALLDDCSDVQFNEAVDAFCESLRSPALV